MTEPGTPKPQRRESVARQRQVAFEVDIPKLLATGAVAAVGAIIGAVLTFLAQMSEIDRKYANLNASLEATHLAQMAEIQRKYDNLDAEMQVKYEAANREVDIKMIEISLAILAGEKGDAEGRPPSEPGYIIPRSFAIRALTKASGIELTPDEVVEWAEAGATTLAKVSDGGLAALRSAFITDYVVARPTEVHMEVLMPEGDTRQFMIGMVQEDCGLDEDGFWNSIATRLREQGLRGYTYSLTTRVTVLRDWRAVACDVEPSPTP